MQTFTNNLIFSLNATIPIFLMMALGFFLQRIHLLDDHTTQKLIPARSASWPEIATFPDKPCALNA